MRQELTVQLQVYTIQINRFAGNSPSNSNSSLGVGHGFRFWFTFFFGLVFQGRKESHWLVGR